MRYIKLSEIDTEPDSKYNKKYKLLMSKLIKKTPNKFLFITINYDPKKHSISCGDPHKSLNKILNTNCIKSWAFTFEWRKHDPPQGLHCHLIILTKNPKMDDKQLVRHIKRQKFDGITELCKKFSTLLYYPMDCPINGLKAKLDYISGNTYCDEKNINKELDMEIREKYIKFKSFSNI